MSFNKIDHIHQILYIYKHDLLVSPLRGKQLTKKECAFIFQTIDQALRQPNGDLSSLSTKDVDKSIESIEMVKQDIETIYDQSIRRSPPKVSSRPRQIVKKILKFFKTFPLLKRFRNPSFKNSYKQLRENLDKIQAQLIDSRDYNDEDFDRRFVSLAEQWQQLLSQPQGISHRQAQKTLDQLLSSIQQKFLHASVKDTKSFVRKYPGLSALFSDDHFESRLKDLIAARRNGKSIASFASDPVIGKQIASLLGEEKSDYRNIPIRARTIAARGFSDPAQHTGFWTLEASSSLFKLLYPEIEKAFLPKEIKCRGLFVDFVLDREEEEKECLEKIFTLADKSLLPFISLSFNRPIQLVLPPAAHIRKQFFQALAKMEIRSPVSIKLVGPLSQEEKGYLHQAMPHVIELDVSHQHIDEVRHLLPSFKELQKFRLIGTQVTDLDLAIWQHKGLFDTLKELDLRECSHLTSHIYFPLPVLMRKTPELRVFFPTSLRLDTAFLPKGEDALRLQALLVRDGKQDVVYPSTERDLSSSNLAVWLNLNEEAPLPPNPNIVVIDAQNMPGLTNAQLIEIIKKFPNAKDINLKGCTQITDAVFSDPNVKAWLREKRFLNLQQTGISLAAAAQLQEQYPLLYLLNITMIVKGKDFTFSKKQLSTLSPYWKQQFSQEGTLYQKDLFSLEDRADQSFDPELFACVTDYIKTGVFKKESFSKEEAEQFFTLSEFFGENLVQICSNVLTNQANLSTTTKNELAWIQNLAERYSLGGLVEMCKEKKRYLRTASPIIKLKESFITASGSTNLILLNSSQNESLSILINPERLSKESSYFEALFRWEKEKGDSNQIFIEEENPQAFLLLFQCVQGGEIPADLKDCLQVLALAKKYAIPIALNKWQETSLEHIMIDFMNTQEATPEFIELLLWARSKGLLSQEFSKVLRSLVHYIETKTLDPDTSLSIWQILNTYIRDTANIHKRQNEYHSYREYRESYKLKKFFIQGKDGGNIDGLFMLGWYYDHIEADFKKAIKYLKQASEQGDSLAQNYAKTIGIAIRCRIGLSEWFPDKAEY